MQAVVLAAAAATAAPTAPPFAVKYPAGLTPAERAYVRNVPPRTANEVTSDLQSATGRRVAFICEVATIADGGTFVGNCGTRYEPVDLYVRTPTAGLQRGDRLRVVGTMEAPGQWVDVTGHSWFTPFLRARYADRLR